jgi:NADH-quinone oxidoreductase subunit L
VKEASFVLWFPMVVIVAGCVFFGVNHSWPLMHLIQPILSEHLLEGHNYAGMPANLWLVLITLLVLAAALLNHWYGVSKTGKGLKAVDHIHYAPGIAFLYDRAEKRYFDPYEIGMHIAHGVVQVGWWIDRSVDWFYDVFTVRLTWAFTGTIRWLHSGNYAFYLVWILMGTVAAMVYLLM